MVAADHAFALLDVKHLQLDSLGHLHAPLLAALGNLSLASTTLDHTAKFFLANYKDVCVFEYNRFIEKTYLTIICEIFSFLERGSFNICIQIRQFYKNSRIC